jgi:hypothetical protein
MEMTNEGKPMYVPKERIGVHPEYNVLESMSFTFFIFQSNDG